MLVLTHKRGDLVHIGEDIKIRVLAVDRFGNIKLGYTAPKEVQILRDKVKERMEGEAK